MTFTRTRGRTGTALPTSSSVIVIVALAFAATMTGCSTYSSSIRSAQHAVLVGQPEKAVSALDKQLKVERSEDLPADLEKNRPLLLLERATILQGEGNYEQAARDMALADQKLEYLDIQANDRFELAKWLFSDDAYDYRAPAYERLLLNALNMVNFLAAGDLNGARVEARRFNLIADFFVNNTNDEIQFDILGLGYYLAGFTFEKSRRLDEALRFYSQAYAYRFQTPDLEERLIQLMRTTGKFSPTTDDAALRKVAETAKSQGVLTRKEFDELYSGFDLLILVQNGMAPYKKPEYLPVGAAITLATAAGPAYRLSGQELQQARLMAGQGMLTTVNVPALVTNAVPYNPPFTLTIDNRSISPIFDVDVTAQVERTWRQMFPSVVASALTRSLTRYLVSQGANQVAQAAGSEGGPATLAALLVQGGMSIADSPDTRSWILLPSFINLYRTTVSAGPQTVRFSTQLGSETRQFNATPHHYKVLNFSKFRQ